MILFNTAIKHKYEERLLKPISHSLFLPIYLWVKRWIYHLRTRYQTMFDIVRKIE